MMNGKFDELDEGQTPLSRTITQLLHFFSKITDLLIGMSVKFKFKLISRYSSSYGIRWLTESVG